jgi:hypothetical protein
MDLASGPSQVLDDGTNTYIYGLDCIVQVNGTNTEFFLADVLGSVRQLTDTSGVITLQRTTIPSG